jgi:hypothetical protein|tara:strand:+ start:274 stop:906 length:633 start_codon:yes stop_codon:yes gene_type:complete
MKRALPVTTTEKYMKVIDLRKAGLTFDEIAEQVGYKSRSGAKEAFDAAIRYWGHESVTELRVIENERVEELWRRTYLKLQDPTLELSEELMLMQTALKITESKRKLHGLDAPRQLELSGRDGEEIQTDVGQLLKERLDALHDRYLQEVESQEAQELPTGGALVGTTADEQGESTGTTADEQVEIIDIEVVPDVEVEVHKGIRILRGGEVR